MDEKQNDTRPQDCYRTGSTTPPKNYGGVIAVLLVAVIFLMGVSTALGLLNIRLFRQIQDQENDALSPVAFSQAGEETEGSALADTVTDFDRLGIKGQALSPFYQVYYHLPQGIYITEVDRTSVASKKGVLPGDVLVGFNDCSLDSEATLQTLMEGCAAGDAVQLVLWRDNIRKTVEVEIG